MEETISQTTNSRRMWSSRETEVREGNCQEQGDSEEDRGISLRMVGPFLEWRDGSKVSK